MAGSPTRVRAPPSSAAGRWYRSGRWHVSPPRTPRPWRAALTCRDSRSEEHTSELQSPCNIVCRLLLEKKKYDLGSTGNGVCLGPEVVGRATQKSGTWTHSCFYPIKTQYGLTIVMGLNLTMNSQIQLEV